MKREKENLSPEKLNEKKNNATFIRIITCLIFAVVIFAILVNVEKNIMKNYKKAPVVVCKQNINEKDDINKSNKKDYFEVVQVPKNIVPENTYKSLKEVPTGLASKNMYKKEILLKNDIQSSNLFVKDIENPVIASISIKSLDKAVGGVLRRGDRVDISLIKDDTNDKSLLLSNIYIIEAMNSSGEKLTKDKKEAATIFNIIVSEKDAQMLKEVVNKNGELTLVKTNDVKY